MSQSHDLAGTNTRHAGFFIELKKEQALRILTWLEEWVDAAPGRGFTVKKTPDGRWGVTLLEVERRTAHGRDLVDALAQISLVAKYEDVPAERGW